MKTRHWIFITIAGAALIAASAYLSLSGPRKGDLASDYSLVDTNGFQVTLSEYRGHPVVVQFWASWCGQCMAEIPQLNEFAKVYSAMGLKVLAISTDDPSDSELVRAIAKNILPNVTVLFDENAKIADAYSSFYLPDTFIIDKNGKIYDRFEGTAGLDWQDGAVKDSILQLLERGD